jgi:hypothetical protein
MPVVRRKLATPTPISRRAIRTSAPISITRCQPQLQPAPSQPFDQRGMNVKVASRYLGISVWQIRKFIREDAVPSFQIGNRDMVDRHDLDALIERLKTSAA